MYHEVRGEIFLKCKNSSTRRINILYKYLLSVRFASLYPMRVFGRNNKPTYKCLKDFLWISCGEFSRRRDERECNKWFSIVGYLRLNVAIARRLFSVASGVSEFCCARRFYVQTEAGFGINRMWFRLLYFTNECCWKIYKLRWKFTSKLVLNVHDVGCFSFSVELI